jgi:SAM-dependent methyltransferase
MLQRAIELLHNDRREVRILDIAAGPGRYVLETMQRHNGSAGGIAGATLRDYMDNNLEAARALAKQFNIANVSIEKGDAFDRASLAAVTPRPSIAIASGLYELFPDNTCVQQSLAGIGDALEPGGYLLYTCQPWHPQVEMIARTLTNREGKPWIMRRRSQAEMDALVRHAGFEKIDQTIDKWGIFTVSLARRVTP